MEFEELNNIWKSMNSDEAIDDFVVESVILKTIKKKSKITISKIKRVMRIKLVIIGLVLILYLAALIMLVLINEYYSFYNRFSKIELIIILGVTSVFLMVYIIYNYSAYKKIQAIQVASNNIKNSLSGIIKIMDRIMKLNVYSDSIVGSILITYTVCILLYDDEVFKFDVRAVYLLIALIVSFFLTYLIDNYIEKLKFGNYVNRLKADLNFLEIEKK